MAALEEFARQYAQWTQDEIPRRNGAIEAGQETVEQLVVAVGPWIEQLLGEALSSSLDRGQARELLKLLGFSLSSIERHTQTRGERPGAGLARLPGTDPLLLLLGAVGQHPPRDTDRTYWALNGGERPLTFTGDRQEMLFNRIVNQTITLHGESVALLRPISDGRVPMLDPEASARLSQVAANTRTLWEAFGLFMVRMEDGAWAMTPDFFMRRMRTYLPSYPVAGRLWTGVNAANIPEQMEFDFLLGTVNDHYSSIVLHRLPYLTQEDQQALLQDVGRTSITARMLAALGLTADQVVALDEVSLKRHLAQQPPEVAGVLQAYTEVVAQAHKLTSRHWALIVNYLIRPSAKLSEEERAHMAVRPDGGTGKMGHDETYGISEMRSKHPIAGKLVECVKPSRVPTTV